MRAGAIAIRGRLPTQLPVRSLRRRSIGSLPARGNVAVAGAIEADGVRRWGDSSRDRPSSHCDVSNRVRRANDARWTCWHTAAVPPICTRHFDMSEAPSFIARFRLAP